MTREQNFNGRVGEFLVSSEAKFKIGRNLIVNRLTVINNKMEIKWIHLSSCFHHLQNLVQRTFPTVNSMVYHAILRRTLLAQTQTRKDNNYHPINAFDHN